MQRKLIMPIIKETYTDDEQRLARYAKALGHPARIAIMKLLAKQTSCFCGEIVDELPIAQATVSQHLKELKSAGLIQGSIDPPKVIYCVNRKEWDEAKRLFNDFFLGSFGEKDSCCKL